MTQTTTPTTVAPDLAQVTDLVDRHLATWSESDAAVRRELLRTCWEPDGTLVDPPIEGEGWTGIDAVMVAMQDHYPEHRFVRTTSVDLHHHVFRVGWELRDVGGSPVLHGTDVGQLSPALKLTAITGFFGELMATHSEGPAS